MREIIEEINHTEYEFIKKTTLMGDIHTVIIQLLVMTKTSWYIDFLSIPWEQFFKSRMAQAKHSLVYQSEYGDIPSQYARREIKIKKGFLRCQIQLL